MEHEMDLSFYFSNRKDVLVIFIDMDSSIFLTDYALPSKLENEDHMQSQGGCVGTHVSKNNESLGSLKTRFEIICCVLRSFFLQKQRASSNPFKMLWFSIYCVTDKVVEVIPLRRRDMNDSFAALQKFFDSYACLAGKNSSQFGLFPFFSVANTLRDIEALFTREIDTCAVGNPGDKYCKTTTLASSQSLGLRGLTVIQGIVLLNRTTAMPLAKELPTKVDDAKTVGVGLRVCRLLDIIPLGQTLSLSFHSKNIPTASVVDVRYSKTSDEDIKLPMVAAESMELDCPCNVINLESFTGVPHRGLALGCALTKLLTPHLRMCDENNFGRPLKRVNVTAFLKNLGGELPPRSLVPSPSPPPSSPPLPLLSGQQQDEERGNVGGSKHAAKVMKDRREEHKVAHV